MQTTFPASRTDQPSRSFIRRTLADFVAIFLAVTLLVGLAGIAAWQFWHTDRIYTGVSVAGVPIGGMTRASALVRLNHELTPYPVAPINVRYGDKQWQLSASQLDVQVDLMGAVNQAYLIGRQHGLASRLLAQWDAVAQGRNVEPALHFDASQVRYQISRIAATVRRPGRPATQVGDRSVPAQPGIDVAVDATAQAVLQQLDRDQAASVPLQVLPVAAPDAGLASPAAPLNGSTRFQPLVLRHAPSNLQFALDVPTLERIVRATDPLALDEETLRTLVEGWAQQIDIAPQDARLHFNPDSGEVTVRTPSVTGRRLDVEQTIATIEQSLRAEQTQAVLPVESVAPAVDMNRIDEMGIRELVASGTTYFAGSSRARIRNIEVAAEKFTGVVIPPDGIFSFNDIVEDVSAANGFEDSLIIWGDRTAVGVGGGVCQVSTTVFRAALNAGFPIVERYNHGYVVSWYGAPGMDATVYTPNVDFRFRNDTGAYLLIEPVVDSVNGTITYLFYGTKPDRQVVISDPVISDVEEPGPPVYQEDDSLAPGQKKQVEWPKKGMKVVVERRVTENGETRVDELVSHYQPWQAVYLVGPGTQVPATPTPAPDQRADGSTAATDNTP